MEPGRPALYTDPEHLEQKMNEYFAMVEEKNKPVTITGLCIYLGFESRQSFYDYEKREGFSYIIKRARLFVENHYETSAQFAKQPTFHIFALKNMGWSDKQEHDHTTKGEAINTVTWNFIDAEKKD